MFEAYHELKSHFLVQVTRSLYIVAKAVFSPPNPQLPPTAPKGGYVAALS
jgi:hypothetical protein